MKRRSVLKSSLLGLGAALGSRRVQAALPKMKITRVRYYRSPNQRPIFNQSFNVIVVETDQGITSFPGG